MRAPVQRWRRLHISCCRRPCSRDGLELTLSPSPHNWGDRMTAEDMGRQGLRLVSRLAGTAIAVPMLAGYFALGATVLVGRSLLDLARQTRGRLPGFGGDQRDQEESVPKAG